jgi:hypothetical protein
MVLLSMSSGLPVVSIKKPSPNIRRGLFIRNSIQAQMLLLALAYTATSDRQRFRIARLEAQEPELDRKTLQSTLEAA